MRVFTQRGNIKSRTAGEKELVGRLINRATLCIVSQKEVSNFSVTSRLNTPRTFISAARFCKQPDLRNVTIPASRQPQACFANAVGCHCLTGARTDSKQRGNSGKGLEMELAHSRSRRDFRAEMKIDGAHA